MTGYIEVAGPADPAASLTIGVLHAPYRRVLDAMSADGAGLRQRRASALKG